MVQIFELKFFELFYRAHDFLYRREEGQTTTEYVAVTAMGLVIAIFVAWFFLQAGITDAVSGLTSRLTSFVSTAS